MQGLKHTVAVFCIGCIASELLAQLVGEEWPRRCIKSLAGLYILVALARGISIVPDNWSTQSVMQFQPAELGSGEQAVLQLAQRQLEQRLAEDCARQTGVQLQLHITLERSGQGMELKQLCAIPAAEFSEGEKKQAEDFFQTALGVLPVWVEDGSR